jgi:uncharacterized protein YjcR
MKAENEGIAIPSQPKDRKNPVYSVIKDYIKYGDYVGIAAKLGLSVSTVRNVAAGWAQSEKVWSAVISLALERKQQESAFVAYFNKK